MGVDIGFFQRMLIPKTKKQLREISKRPRMGKDRSKAGLVDYLFAKKEWWQANFASHYCQQHYQVLHVAGQRTAFSCLKGWDTACWTHEMGADQSRGCGEFEELFCYLYLSFYFDLTWGVWRVLHLLGVTVTLRRACMFHQGTALWVRSHLGAAAEAAAMS